MTSLLRSHPIPAAYRRSRVESLDVRFRRALGIASAPAMLLLLLVAVLPARNADPVSVSQLPERFARLILEESPAPAEPTPAAPPSEKLSPETENEAPQPKAEPKPAPRVRRDRAPKVAQDRGQQGRERAQKQVVTQVAKVTESLDKSLSAITGSLDRSSASASDQPQRRRGRSTRQGRGRTARVGDRETSAQASVGSAGTVSVAAIDLGSVAGVEGGTGGTGSGATASGSAGSLHLGERSQSSLLQVVRRYAPGIRYCYDHALKSNPDLQGKMAFRLRIAADGHVSGVDVVEDTLLEDEVRQCALAQIQDWVFPAASTETVFDTPFVFRPRR